MLRLLLAAVLLVLLAPGVSEAQTLGLDIVQPEQLALTFDDRESSKASVWVRNTTDRRGTPVFQANVENSEGNASRIAVVLLDGQDKPTTAQALPARSVRRYRLLVRSSGKPAPEDVSGLLIVRGVGAPGSIPLAVGKKKAFADQGVTAALLWPLLPAALLILLAGALAIHGTTTLRSPLPADLDFKTSFASTVTAAGAVLATVIAASVLPEETATLSKEAFVALNLVFGIAVVVAGLVYAALQRPVWVDAKKEKPTDPDIQQRNMQGRVWGFLVASLITVWAVFGELLTVWLLLDELGQEQGFSDTSLFVFKLLIAAAAFTMAVYTWRRIPAIVASQRRKPAQTTLRGQVTRDETRTTTPTAEPMRSVSLL